MLKINQINEKSVSIDSGNGPIVAHSVFYAQVVNGILELIPEKQITPAFSEKLELVEINGTVYINPEEAIQALTFIGNFKPGGASSLPTHVEITYSQLVQLITDSKLVLGQKYLITDYRTIYLHPFYDAGDRLGEEGTDVVTPIEPLIVTADSVNTLNYLAQSLLYPEDEIHYNYRNDVLAWTDDQCKGAITFRKDTVNNVVAYEDWRHIKYRHYMMDTDSLAEYADSAEIAEKQFVKWGDDICLFGTSKAAGDVFNEREEDSFVTKLNFYKTALLPQDCYTSIRKRTTARQQFIETAAVSAISNFKPEATYKSLFEDVVNMTNVEVIPIFAKELSGSSIKADKLADCKITCDTARIECTSMDNTTLLLQSSILYAKAIAYSDLTLYASNIHVAIGIINSDMYLRYSTLHFTDTGNNIEGCNIRYAGWSVLGNVFKTSLAQYANPYTYWTVNRLSNSAINGSSNQLNASYLHNTTINASASGNIITMFWSTIKGGSPVFDIKSANYFRFSTTRNWAYPLNIDTWGIYGFADSQPNNVDLTKYATLMTTNNDTGGRQGKILSASIGNGVRVPKLYWTYINENLEVEKMLLEPDLFKILKP